MNLPTLSPCLPCCSAEPGLCKGEAEAGRTGPITSSAQGLLPPGLKAAGLTHLNFASLPAGASWQTCMHCGGCALGFMGMGMPCPLCGAMPQHAGAGGCSAATAAALAAEMGGGCMVSSTVPKAEPPQQQQQACSQAAVADGPLSAGSPWNPVSWSMQQLGMGNGSMPGAGMGMGPLPGLMGVPPAPVASRLFPQGELGGLRGCVVRSAGVSVG